MTKGTITLSSLVIRGHLILLFLLYSVITFFTQALWLIAGCRRHQRQYHTSAPSDVAGLCVILYCTSTQILIPGQIYCLRPCNRKGEHKDKALILNYLKCQEMWHLFMHGKLSMQGKAHTQSYCLLRVQTALRKKCREFFMPLYKTVISSYSAFEHRENNFTCQTL